MPVAKLTGVCRGQFEIFVGRQEENRVRSRANLCLPPFSSTCNDDNGRDRDSPNDSNNNRSDHPDSSGGAGCNFSHERGRMKEAVGPSIKDLHRLI